MLQRTADAKAASSDLPDSQPAESGGVRAGLTLTTRLAVAMIVLVAGAVFAVGWLSYRSLEQALIPRVLAGRGHHLHRGDLPVPWADRHRGVEGHVGRAGRRAHRYAGQ